MAASARYDEVRLRPDGQWWIKVSIWLSVADRLAGRPRAIENDWVIALPVGIEAVSTTMAREVSDFIARNNLLNNPPLRGNCTLDRRVTSQWPTSGGGSTGTAVRALVGTVLDTLPDLLR